jgi:uncharacterized membrane protein
MLIASVQFIDVVLFFHILGVVLWIGPTYGYAFFIANAESAHPRAVPSVMESIVKIDNTLGNVGALLVIASGIYMVEDVGWDYSEFFVSWGFAAFIVFLGLAHGFFGPRSRKLRDLAIRDLGESGEGALSDEYTALSRQVAMVGTLTGLIAAVTIYVMAVKPFP